MVNFNIGMGHNGPYLDWKKKKKKKKKKKRRRRRRRRRRKLLMFTVEKGRIFRADVLLILVITYFGV